ncbi:MAG TPA: cupin domain-containing protein [Burkholderiales bacterium]|nr:cupin domain-containing protein [Burkholderiales bacterium]
MNAPDKVRADTAMQSPTQRARYCTSENPFTFGYPAVPARQFLAERDRAFDASTPTSTIALDASDALATAYMATTPTLLCRYFRIRAGEELHTAFLASSEVFYVMHGSGESRNQGESIAWGTGDVLCFPSGETLHRAQKDSMLFGVSDEPLLSFEGLRPPPADKPAVRATHWPAVEIEKVFQGVYTRPRTIRTTGCSVMFSCHDFAPGYHTTPLINTAINTLEAGGDQRPHRHNGAAITLAIQGEGIHSMIEDTRVDWSDGAAQITPASLLHSHHNRSDRRMRSFVIQDEGLHYYTRTPGFSFG